MPGSSSPQASSFIPKRGPARRRNTSVKKQLFLFSIITYSLLFAALLAALGTFLYKNYLTSLLEEEVKALTVSIDTFSQSDLLSVYETDLTLRRATDRVDNNASVKTVLDSLDIATAEPVQIRALRIERLGDSAFSLDGDIITTSFDAAMFQREVFRGNSGVFPSMEITQVAVENELSDDVASGQQQSVTFQAALEVPLNSVLYDPSAAAPQFVPAPAVTEPVEAIEEADAVSEDLSSTEELEV